MITIRNIERFFFNHPELWEKKYPILGRADSAKEKNGTIPECLLGMIFGYNEVLLKLFYNEEIINKDQRLLNINDFKRKHF